MEGMMEKNKKVYITGIILCVLLVLAIVSVAMQMDKRGVFCSTEKKIALITVDGPIVGGDEQGAVFGATTATSGTLMRQIREATADEQVGAILLRLDSPGGSAAATQEVARELQRAKDKHIPIIVSMGDTAASGAYWLATYGDKIFANPSTITGSIGVYMSYYDVQGLSKKIGVHEEKIKSGMHKDIFSPFRDMTPEERQITQQMVNDMYNQFVMVVAKGRHMDPAVVKPLADGRIYTGTQAKALGLIDELGNYYDALNYTKKKLHISDDDCIVTYDDMENWKQWVHGQLQSTAVFQNRFALYGQEVVRPLALMKEANMQ